MQKSISIGVTFGIFITIALIVIGFVIGINNRGIAFEETIKANYSNIDKELQRKYSVFTNMVDAIQSYNKYESETLAKIIEAPKSGVDMVKVGNNYNNAYRFMRLCKMFVYKYV